MRAVFWNFVFATWLLVSAFLFPRVPVSIAIVLIAAVAVITLSAVSAGKPGARYVISAIAVALAFIALLLPGLSAAARLSDAVVAALLFLLSLVSPVHRARSGERVASAAH